MTTKQTKANHPPTKGQGTDIPPLWEHVKIYFMEKGEPETAGMSFYQHYKNKRWKNASGRHITNWKLLAWNWICNHIQA